MTNDGDFDYDYLEKKLQENSGRNCMKVGSFSAGSNIVGTLFDTDRLAIMCHKYGSLAIFDYAAVAPYVEINMNDVRIDYFCSSGPGGQSVNTTYSAIKLHHEPTGMIVSCQDQKSSHKNLEKALKVLRSRLYEIELAKKQAADSAKRKSMVSSGDRSAKIRTYNYSQGRVTDHRIGLTLYDLSNIINGDIQKLVDELMLAENTEILKASNENI